MNKEQIEAKAEEMFHKYVEPQINDDGYIFGKNAWIFVEQITRDLMEV